MILKSRPTNGSNTKSEIGSCLRSRLTTPSWRFWPNTRESDQSAFLKVKSPSCLFVVSLLDAKLAGVVMGKSRLAGAGE